MSGMANNVMLSLEAHSLCGPSKLAFLVDLLFCQFNFSLFSKLWLSSEKGYLAKCASQSVSASASSDPIHHDVKTKLPASRPWALCTIPAACPSTKGMKHRKRNTEQGLSLKGTECAREILYYILFICLGSHSL